MDTLQVNLFLAFLWSFMVSVFAIPSIIHLAHLKNLLDEPNFRTMHVSLTPRLGGLAIFAGFISSITIFGDMSHSVQKVLGGTLLLFFIGMKDDIVAISAAKKFLIQVLSAGIIVFLGDVRITGFQGFLGINELPEGISFGFSLLVIIGITNAINLIDGLDGLAGSISSLIVGTFGAYFYMLGKYDMAFLAVCLLGALIGFLRYNVHKAIIFMGDTGSLVCGFLISVLCIQFIEMKQVHSAPSIALATVFVPVFDTLRVFAVRMMRGKSPFSPDKSHIHHIFAKARFSQLATVFTILFINASVVTIVVLFRHLGNNVLLPAMAGLFIVSSIILTTLDKKFMKRQNTQSVSMNQELPSQVLVDTPSL